MFRLCLPFIGLAIIMLLVLFVLAIKVRNVVDQVLEERKEQEEETLAL